MNCYETIDLMGDVLDGSLAPEHRAGFHEHLSECTPCRTYLDQLRVTLRALEGLPRPQVSAERRSELIAAFHREREEG
jgi:predicted anti-sigma-YlaC factor YlaD